MPITITAKIITYMRKTYAKKLSNEKKKGKKFFRRRKAKNTIFAAARGLADRSNK
jgi:hypothetical protein